MFPLLCGRPLTSFLVIAVVFVLASGYEKETFPLKQNGCSNVAEASKKEEGDSSDSPNENTEEKRKWGDKNMRLWGKRGELDNEISEKRGWNNGLRAWGKREDEEEKRELSVKRDWNSGLRAWGKREEEEDKRAWSTGGLRAWGKRDEVGKEEKRKWGDNKMRVWGKRNPDSNEQGKRGWEKNALKAWGKRERTKVGEQRNIRDETNNGIQELVERTENAKEHLNQKTPSASDASPKTTNDQKTEQGPEITKRAIERVKRSWNADQGSLWNRMHYYPPEGPKRSWRTNVIRVWGKRMAL